MPTAIHIISYLKTLENPVRAVHEKAYLKTTENSFGIPRGPIRQYVKQLVKKDEHISLADLKKLWDTHILDARYLAMTYAETQEKLWDTRWLKLFLYWAETTDTGWHNTDVLGPHLLGSAYIQGLCKKSDLVKLKRSKNMWAWRVGMTTLIPSLKQSSRDWKFLCDFAKECLPTNSKFYKYYFALKGLSMTVRWAIGGNKTSVLRFLKDNKTLLPKWFITETYNKVMIGRKR